MKFITTSLLLLISLIWLTELKPMHDQLQGPGLNFKNLNIMSPIISNPQRNDKNKYDFFLRNNNQISSIEEFKVAQARDVDFDILFPIMRERQVKRCCIEQNFYDADDDCYLVDHADDDNFIAEPLKLSRLLNDNPHLKSLRLYGSRLTIDPVDFYNALKNAHFIDLQLDRLDVPQNELTTILEAVKISSSIKNLLLSNIRIIGDDYYDKIDIIPYLNQNLQRLDIDYVIIPDTQHFVDGVKKSKLETLVLLDIPLSAVGIIKRILGFTESNHLEGLWRTDINDENAQFDHLCLDVNILRQPSQTNITVNVGRDTNNKTIFLTMPSQAQ